MAFQGPVVGVVTDGTELHVTRDGARTWRRATVEGAVPPLRIVALAAGTGRLYAVVSGSSATRLHVMSPNTARFTPVPGVEVPGTADGEIALGNGRTHVVLSAVRRINGYWVERGHRWVRTDAPCPLDAATELATAGQAVYALCSQDPGMGRMSKLLRVSDAGAPFRSLGEAPREGITTGLAAASPSTVAVTAVGRGAGWLHLRERYAQWTTPLAAGGTSLRDLTFTDAEHGALVRGGPQQHEAQLLLTSDGGVTWRPVDFSSTANRRGR